MKGFDVLEVYIYYNYFFLNGVFKSFREKNEIWILNIKVGFILYLKRFLEENVFNYVNREWG